MRIGSGDHMFEWIDNWPRIPDATEYQWGADPGSKRRRELGYKCETAAMATRGSPTATERVWCIATAASANVARTRAHCAEVTLWSSLSCALGWGGCPRVAVRRALRTT